MMAKNVLQSKLWRALVLAMLFLLSAMVALVSQPIEANIPLQTFELPLPNATAAIASVDELAEVPTGLVTQWVEIKSGDNLGVIMERAGLSASLAAQISASPNGQHFAKLRAGTHIELKFDENNQLIALNYHFSNLNILTAERTDDNGFAVQQIIKPVESQIVSYSGRIDNSLYVDGRKAGMQPQQIMDMADVFAWDIDFGREILPGTSFNAIFEVPFADGEIAGTGKLLAAKITIGKDEHTAFWHKTGGANAYFNKDGNSLRKAFNRNPVDYVRITSGFTKARYHPVLHEMRAHKGVDYGAPVGTPVHATGDGKITMRGWGNGYGNMITIQHGQTYSTVYGHLSRYGRFQAGATVKQGDVIGYVGMTGLASGPHLHYEFRVKGQHVDPLGVKFTEVIPIAAKEKPAFLTQVALMSERMSLSILDTVAETTDEAAEMQQLADAANFE
jgi:murein DD-endopeptidase MepM/ murein hydrolase activator NlpD